MPVLCHSYPDALTPRERGGSGGMWNSFNTGATDGMTGTVVSIKGANGDQIHAYVARPEGKGPFPGIVLVHHIPGWDEFYREMTRRFAQHGYNAICPDLFCR